MRRLMFIVSLLILMATGCGTTPIQPYEVTSTAESSYATANVSLRPTQINELDQAERRWLSAGISNYRIIVEKGNVFAGAQHNTIIVQNGQVITKLPVCQTYNTPNCLFSNEKAEDYSVPGLFAAIRGKLNTPNLLVKKVTYDPVYGYPRTFTSDVFHRSDSLYVQNVTDFAPL